jgi:hypothetical protein
VGGLTKWSIIITVIIVVVRLNRGPNLQLTEPRSKKLPGGCSCAQVAKDPISVPLIAKSCMSVGVRVMATAHAQEVPKKRSRRGTQKAETGSNEVKSAASENWGAKLL